MSIAAIASAIVGAAAKNMKQTREREQAAESGYNIDAIKQQNPNMQIQQSPAMQNGATSPTGNLMAGLGVPQQAQKQMPVIGGALKGEEAMLQNQTIPVVGGYTIQPKTFSSASPYYRTQRLI